MTTKHKYILTIAIRRRIADVSWRQEYYSQLRRRGYANRYSAQLLDAMWAEHKHIEYARETYGEFFK